jgi:hypothetical protein
VIILQQPRKGPKIATKPRRTTRPGTQRAIQTGGTKVGDRADVDTQVKIRFTSSTLPKWARGTTSLDALLLILYLRGSRRLIDLVTHLPHSSPATALFRNSPYAKVTSPRGSAVTA